tara:strand:+ start:2649 stop:3713 length:1065 start_codon:yes stop_codon:yes gene_type:complete
MNTISPSKLLLVARSWSQRGQNTDYEQFFSFFPGSINITNNNKSKFDNFIYRKLKNLANQDGYSSLSAYLEYRTFIKSMIYRPQLIHFWFADHDYHFSSYTANLIGAKIVGNFFFSVEEFERRIPDKRFIKKLDLITASGKKQMDYLSNYFPKEKIIFLPLGIDTNFYCPPKKNNRFNKSTTLLHVGKNRRDFEVLKKVFLLIQKKIPSVKLELVGGKSAMTLFSDVKNVTFHPFVSDEELLKIYQNSTLLLLPLKEGGSSQTLNEAMSTGLPVATNQLPNLEDYVLDDNSLISPKGNSELMAKNCIKILKNKNHWELISKKSREHSAQFDFKRVKNQIIEIYKEHLDIKVIGI